MRVYFTLAMFALAGISVAIFILGALGVAPHTGGFAALYVAPVFMSIGVMVAPRK